MDIGYASVVYIGGNSVETTLTETSFSRRYAQIFLDNPCLYPWKLMNLWL